MSTLPTRALGNSGLHTTVIGLGTNNFGGRLDLEGTRAVVDAALDAGVTFFDTADIYGRHFGTGADAVGQAASGRSEELLGQVLRGRRDQVVLATKFGKSMGDGDERPRGSAAYIAEAAQASLRRLGTEVIDLYWMHEPDEATRILETLTALQELISAGTVRAIGASNFSPAQLREAAAVAAEHGLTPFSALQNEYSLLKTGPENDGTLAACDELGVGFVPYFPLASGLLTGKYSAAGERPGGARLTGRDELASDEEWEVIEGIRAYARERGVTMIQVAIGALLNRPMVSSVIAGATSAEQIAQNAAAAEWDPTPTELSKLWEIVAVGAA